MKNRIPEEFYRGDNHPVVRTVGELIRELQRLPEELPIGSGFNAGAQLTVYNVPLGATILMIDEVDEE